MNYVRDKRSPIPKNETTSRVMSANRPEKTGPEELLYSIIPNVHDYVIERNSKMLTGKPDIAFIDFKLAVFVHGCFWHQCPHCKKVLPKHNSEFWNKKFQDNKRRDRAKARLLRAEGWRVIQIWECRLKSNQQRELNRILINLC